jgi:hypothetical protein
MEAHEWSAPSGISVRELVWGLLTVARAYEPVKHSEESAAVAMLIIDGEDFLKATEWE